MYEAFSHALLVKSKVPVTQCVVESVVNFSFKPGERDPHGYINVSRAREFYLEYTSSFINKDNPTNVIVLADVINFLLVKNGTAFLKYTT